jgi:OmpA-OmpF porin, OOP family
MKRLIFGGLVTVGAVSGSAIAANPPTAGDPTDDTGAVYIDGLGQYTVLDDRRDARQTSKDNFGYQLGIGYNFMPNFAVELNDSNGSYKLKGYSGSSGPSEKLNALSLDLMFKLLPSSSRFRPYVIAGGGELNDTIGGHAETNHAWMAEAGVGMLTGLGAQTGSTRLQLRTEAKYRWEFIQNAAYIPNNPGDIVVGVGLQLSFGNPTPPPPVAMAPPPPPPPPPPAVETPPPAPECHPPAGFKVDANCRIIEQSVVVRAVDFEFNSAQLTGPAQQTLDEVAAALASQPELNVEIQGYTDSTGAAAYNLRLSQRRAEAVKAYLISKGVNGSLTAKGYGKASPIATNDTTEGRAQNRRVEFQVTNAPPHVNVVTVEEATPQSTEAAKQGEPERAKKEHHEQ